MRVYAVCELCVCCVCDVYGGADFGAFRRIAYEKEIGMFKKDGGGRERRGTKERKRTVLKQKE